MAVSKISDSDVFNMDVVTLLAVREALVPEVPFAPLAPAGPCGPAGPAGPVGPVGPDIPNLIVLFAIKITPIISF